MTRLWLWLGLPHWYVSTGCLHGTPEGHAYCRANSGLSGAKAPGRCKHCRARCRCRCHRPVRGTAGRCPACRRTTGLTADGRIAAHRDRAADRLGLAGLDCEGTGWTPEETDGEETRP